MKRVFLIHRWSGGPEDDWRPWLQGELKKTGCQVFVPSMPDTETPVIEKWVSHLAKIVGTPDTDTYFIGHSIGCQAILRYLETIEKLIGGAVFVSGWFNLKNLEDEETRRVAKPWIETPIDFSKVKHVLPKSTLIISDNDPYDASEENKQKFTELGSKIVVLHNAGHITEDSGYLKLPEALAEFRKF
jgi:predicted alpha/beta hydrolase family esterase